MAKKKSTRYKPPKADELPPNGFDNSDDEKEWHVEHYSKQKGCTKEEATTAYEKNAKSRLDHQQPPRSLIPDQHRSPARATSNYNTPSTSNTPTRATSNYNIPSTPTTPTANMAPSGGRQDKKAKDAGRASTSRNTTPSGSIAGSTVNNAATTQSPFTKSHLRTDAVSKQSSQSSLEAPSGSSAPDSSTIRGMVEYSEDMVVEAKHDQQQLHSGQQKLLDAERTKAAALAEVQEDVEMGGVAEQAGTPTASKKSTQKKRRNKKKPKATSADGPLVPGAHTVAAQDGSHFDNGSLAAAAPMDPDTASSSLSPAQATPVAAAAPVADAMDIDDAEDVTSELQGKTEKLIFGDDPTKFDDPTVYEITKVRPGMSDAEIKVCAAVSSFPRSNLHHLTAGSPPDRDFVQSKPTNQVQASTFATSIDPYFRPLVEDDAAFVNQKPDLGHALAMPKLGRHYSEIWAEEDGVEAPEGSTRKPVAEARGSMDDMSDAVAETDKLSISNVMNRFMALFRDEHRAPDDSTSNVAEEDVGENDELAAILEGSTSKPSSSRTTLPPATRLTEPSTEPGKKYVTPKLSVQDERKRLVDELIFAGLVDEGTVIDDTASAADQVAALLRAMQDRLRVVHAQNNARMSIVRERMDDYMAFQEFTHISDDLDNQVTNQYQKRTRTMGKKTKKRSGGAGGGANAGAGGMAGVAKPGLEGATKTAMDRRKKWKEEVGPVFDDPKLGKVPRAEDEGSFIFTPEAMARHMAIEAALMEEEDAEAEDE